MPTLKESSKTVFTEPTVTHEGVRTGSLQRMEDALEVIAKDKTQLEKDLAYYKDLASMRLVQNDSLIKENRGLKGWITRHKNKISALNTQINTF